jgi:phosphotransferase system IIA component
MDLENQRNQMVFIHIGWNTKNWAPSIFHPSQLQGRNIPDASA